ncbi:hypothetical protein GCM10010988_39060 [Cnuibacter physcomitrellae]|uniref:Abortive phage infection protein C-terminal domain-containing protein n=1 Tax=Cnuibacter physcomitrellae TaxID=1619308 RepID=A0A1X9LQU3_9MICO|nr:AIPR family protein [Cnuibacter physcomitrellae]ARJ07555.1 hypothetical protein B5808_19345 [Cnuibacter physcomitrellae]GGI42444.1 hypothetical protein GCM10010988_39060 [Cnuibacter physcomitrellae]
MTKAADRQSKYESIARVANPDASEGLNRQRSILVLWYLRNIVGFDDLDAYEYISDGTDDRGIDALYLENGLSDDDEQTLILVQSKYPESPKEVSEGELALLVGYAGHFANVESLDALMNDGPLEPALKALILRLQLRSKLAAQKLKIRLVFITAGWLNKKAIQLKTATNAQLGSDYLTTYDLDRLAPLCDAFLEPRPVSVNAVVLVPKSQRFEVTVDGRKHVIAAVPAKAIVKWPGIEDRTLFDMNVRKELRPNRVSRSLRKALEKEIDHKNFLAFHNGLTVVSDSIVTTPSRIKLEGISVVNGAQSVLALRDREAQLTEALLLMVKFVEIGEHIQVAREVARRSNSQNPVNARNLRALSGIQLRLKADFEANYPLFHYITHPDAGAKYPGTQIPNDLAAQWLCAVYVQQPWLAVKLLALFEEENYRTIFRENITAAHIILCQRIVEAVERNEAEIPEQYLDAKKLTHLVVTFLIAELMRTNADTQKILDEPADAVADLPALDARLDELVSHAAGTLAMRVESKKTEDSFDDYKIDFKNRDELLQLAGKAREQYAYLQRVSKKAMAKQAK